VAKFRPGVGAEGGHKSTINNFSKLIVAAIIGAKSLPQMHYAEIIKQIMDIAKKMNGCPHDGGHYFGH
jgi:hypothetical protein